MHFAHFSQSSAAFAAANRAERPFPFSVYPVVGRFIPLLLHLDLPVQEKRIDDLAANGDPVGFAQHLRIQLQLFSIALQKNSAIGNPVGLKVHQRPSIGFLKDQVSNTLYGDPMLSDVRQHRLQLFGTQLRLKGKLAAHPGAFSIRSKSSER